MPLELRGGLAAVPSARRSRAWVRLVPRRRHTRAALLAGARGPSMTADVQVLLVDEQPGLGLPRLGGGGVLEHVVPEGGVDLPRPMLRVEADTHRRVGVVSIGGLAILAGHVHAITDARPIAVVALGVDAGPLHPASAAGAAVPELVVEDVAGGQEDVRKIPLGLLGGALAASQIVAAHEAAAENLPGTGVALPKVVGVAVAQRLVAHDEFAHLLGVEGRELRIGVVRIRGGGVRGVQGLVVRPIGRVVPKDIGAALQFHDQASGLGRRGTLPPGTAQPSH
mmetsp:Transcript_109281/g.214175  ORF Transcript_109281/g.214175 Transcript_109281/m.214175 type:complete len:281 (+) Transcript_109281:215-1057(+)